MEEPPQSNDRPSALLDRDLASPFEAADAVNALNSGQIEIFLKYKEELERAAEDDVTPTGRLLVTIELAKVCYAAREHLTIYGDRIPLWQRHLDAAYLDAYQRYDTKMLDGISELMLSFGGRIPTQEDIDALENEEGR